MHDVSKQDPIHWTEQQNLIDEIGQRDDTGAKTGVFKSLMHDVSKQDPTEQQNLIDEIGQRDDTGAKTGVFKSLMHAVSKQDPKLWTEEQNRIDEI